MNRKKKDRSQTETRSNQHGKDYNRVMTIEQAVKMYMSSPQIMPFIDWLKFKGIETYEEVYR